MVANPQSVGSLEIDPPDIKPRALRARAVWRLASLLAETIYACVRLLVASAALGATPERVQCHGQRWSRRLVRQLGLRVAVEGALPEGGCLIVANHRSYIDIVPIYSCVPGFFLAKAEVARWPVLGWATRLSQSIFVDRADAASRKAARAAVAERLRRGHRVIVFAEGTTFAGPDILPFRPALFELAAREDLPVVPVAIDYADPADAWIGDDTFVWHFIERFARPTIELRLAIGPALRHIDADMLRTSAEGWIRDALASPDRGRRGAAQRICPAPPKS